MHTLLDAPQTGADKPPLELAGVPVARYVLTFDRVGRGDVASVGGKGANLGEMLHARLPVPPGFVVTAQAFTRAMEASGANEKISALLATVNVDDPKALQDASARAQEIMRETTIPDDVRGEIL